VLDLHSPFERLLIAADMRLFLSHDAD
jgi:hypothetical protein